MILSQALVASLAKGPARSAIRFLDKDTTYSDLVAAVSRFSYMFQKEIGPQARVAFIGSNSPAFVTAFFALTNNRSLVIPIDPGLSDDEIAEWIYDTHPTHIMVTGDVMNRVQYLLTRRAVNIPIIEIERKHGGEYATSYVPPTDNVPVAKDPILLLRTAGTAGRYKYVLFNHTQIQGAVAGLKRGYHPGPTDRFLTTLNWSHPYALMHGMLFPLLAGSTCVIDHGLELGDFLTFLVQAKVTRLIGFPDFFQKLLLACHSTDHNLIVKSITVSMGELNEEAKQGYKKMKIPVAYCYGQTENLWSISMSDTAAIGTMPCALSGFQYKVLDEGGDEVEGKGRRRGQLAVTGPAVMMRYEARNSKEEETTKHTTQSVIRGTWLYTGDLFDMDGSGEELKLNFIGRKDGFQAVAKTSEGFDAAAIERVIGKLEGITDVAALQIGGSRGPILCALVRAKECTLSDHEVLEAARGGLRPKNIPSILFRMAEIPRDAQGNHDLAAIEAIYTESQKEKKVG